VLADFGVFLGLKRLAAVVMEGQKYLDQMHRDHRRSEPQHSEHEKQRRRDRGGNQQRSETPDMLRSAYGYRPGRSTTLDHAVLLVAELLVHRRRVLEAGGT
jgi:hypothetical protein